MGGGLLPNFMTEFRSVVDLRGRRTDNLVVAESEKCKVIHNMCHVSQCCTNSLCLENFIIMLR